MLPAEPHALPSSSDTESYCSLCDTSSCCERRRTSICLGHRVDNAGAGGVGSHDLHHPSPTREAVPRMRTVRWCALGGTTIRPDSLGRSTAPPALLQAVVPLREQSDESVHSHHLLNARSTRGKHGMGKGSWEYLGRQSRTSERPCCVIRLRSPIRESLSVSRPGVLDPDGRERRVRHVMRNFLRWRVKFFDE